MQSCSFKGCWSLYIWFSGEDEWRAEQRDGSEVPLQWSAETQDISVISDSYFPMYFVAPRRSFKKRGFLHCLWSSHSLSPDCKDFFPFQASSWATKFWVMVRTWPSPSVWTDETHAFLQRTWCWKGLGWECRCLSLPRATPTPVRAHWPTPSGECGPSLARGWSSWDLACCAPCPISSWENKQH